MRWGDSDRWKMWLFEQAWFNFIINIIGWRPICQDAGFKGPVAEAVREIDKNWKTDKAMTTEPLLYFKCFLCLSPLPWRYSLNGDWTQTGHRATNLYAEYLRKKMKPEKEDPEGRGKWKLKRTLSFQVFVQYWHWNTNHWT